MKLSKKMFFHEKNAIDVVEVSLFVRDLFTIARAPHLPHHPAEGFVMVTFPIYEWPRTW